MRAYLPAYELRTPRSLPEALAVLRDEPGIWRPFAGGTDLMVVLETGKLSHLRYLNLWGLGELRGIEVTDAAVTLGALTTYSDVQRHPVLAAEFPMLCEAAAQTGAWAIQSRGTLGGNIANGSPAADSPPALLVYEAELELVSTEGSRWVPYAGFHTGYKKSLLRAGELIHRIRLPRLPGPPRMSRAGEVSQYRKVGTRKAQAISKVCFAARARKDGNKVSHILIALGSVAPTPMRCLKIEAALRGHALTDAKLAEGVALLRQEITPIDDIRSNAEYRLRVTENLLRDFLVKLKG
jgi:CO/xanthine dehydrogenase FAD-binding subunit